MRYQLPAAAVRPAPRQAPVRARFRRVRGARAARGDGLHDALTGAFATDDADELTLTPAGRYLTVVLYRQYLAGLNNLREQARAKLPGDERDLLFGDGTEK